MAHCKTKKNSFPQFLIFNFSLLIILTAFALRLYRLNAQSIWWDEGHSILMASAPVAEIATQPGMDVHPPGFFILLHGWMALAGPSEFALRYLSVGFSLLTVAMLFRFGYRLGGWRVGLCAGALAALSPLGVTYAQEVRMYAMLVFFATASVFFQFGIQRSAVSGQKGRKSLALYVLATATALYTHYFTLFLLAFENLAWGKWVLAGWRRGDFKLRLVVWIGGQAGVLLLSLPQFLFASRQIAGYANPNLKPPALTHYLSRLWQAYTLGLTIEPLSARPYLIGLAILLAAGIIAGLVKRSKPAVFLLGWLVVPPTLYLAVLQVRPSFEPRYLMLVAPAIILLWALAANLHPRGWLIPGLAAILLLPGLYSYYFNPAFFKDDAAGVTGWLAAQTTPADVVLVDVPHPFHYYANRIPALTDYLFVDIHTAADTLNARALGKNRLYWVTWWGSDTDPREAVPFLLQKQAGPPLEDKQFKGYRVRVYRLSDQPFSLPANLPPADVNFDNILRLDGLAYGDQLAVGQVGWATLHFSLAADTAVNYKLSLRLRAPDGRVLAQTDRLLLNDRHFQTAAWPPDDPALNQAVNVFTLPLTDPAYTGPLTLEAVVYNAETLASIAAYGAPTTGNDLVSAQIGVVTVNP